MHIDLGAQSPSSYADIVFQGAGSTGKEPASPSVRGARQPCTLNPAVSGGVLRPGRYGVVYAFHIWQGTKSGAFKWGSPE
jgi:hypothetical protein